MKVHKFLSIRLIAIMSILIWSALSISAQVSADAGKELFKMSQDVFEKIKKQLVQLVTPKTCVLRQQVRH